MGAKRYARVLIRSAEPGRILEFLRKHAFDMGHGRMQRHESDWVAEFYCPEDDASSLVAEGCQFRVDRGFFERLQKFRREEEKRRLSMDDLKAAYQRGELPGTQTGKPNDTNPKRQ
jgi:hypothetical protein